MQADGLFSGVRFAEAGAGRLFPHMPPPHCAMSVWFGAVKHGPGTVRWLRRRHKSAMGSSRVPTWSCSGSVRVKLRSWQLFVDRSVMYAAKET
jgi:hypothetical protein